MPDTATGYRTAHERRTAANAAAATARVQARAASYDPDEESGPNTGGPITPALAKRIRLEIEGRRRG